MNIGKVHEKLKPLCWLIGEWRSAKAVINYPAMKVPLTYSEKLSFISMGKPLLSFSSITFSDTDGSPLHLESGFLCIDDDNTTVSFVTAQSSGVVLVEEGEVQGNTIITNTSCIGHMKFNKYKIVSFQRCYKLNEEGELEYCTMLETPDTPPTQYISAIYKKCKTSN